MSAGELHVEVQGGDIIIALPGTEFTVTYYRWEDPPLLAGRPDWMIPAPRSSWVNFAPGRGPAVGKARELVD